MTYVVPGNAPNIGILNDDRTVTNIDYPESFKNLENNVYDKFYGYAIYQDAIYLFPYVHDNMLVIRGDKLETIKTEYEWDLSVPDSEQFLETLHAYGDRICKESGDTIQESSVFNLDTFIEYIKSV